MTTLPIPSESDWENYKDDIDASYAHDLFIGKTNEEMQVHFRRCVIERADELRWMPKIPFRYYMLGFRDFVMSGNYDDWGADVASCFIGLVEEKLAKEPDFILPIMPQLMPAIEYVANNQKKFGATEKIYGNFMEKFKRIKEISENPQKKE
jgi:hypothetical protein